MPGQGAGMINTAVEVVHVRVCMDVDSGDNSGSQDVAGRGMSVGWMLAVGVSAVRVVLTMETMAAAVKGQEWVGWGACALCLVSHLR